MNKFSNLIATVLSISGAGYLIWRNSPDYRAYGLSFLFIIGMSYLFEKKFEKWQIGLGDGPKSGFKYLLIGLRTLVCVSLILILGIPKIYELAPPWVNRETIGLLNTIKKNGEIYNLEIKYEDKYPDKKNELFVYLRDTSIFQSQINECVIGAEAHPVIIKLIGTPKDWLNQILLIFLIISIGIFLSLYPYTLLGKK